MKDYWKTSCYKLRMLRRTTLYLRQKHIFPDTFGSWAKRLSAAQEGVNTTPDDLEISELKMSLVLKIFSRSGIKGIHVNSLINIQTSNSTLLRRYQLIAWKPKLIILINFQYILVIIILAGWQTCWSEALIWCTDSLNYFTVADVLAYDKQTVFKNAT